MSQGKTATRKRLPSVPRKEQHKGLHFTAAPTEGECVLGWVCVCVGGSGCHAGELWWVKKGGVWAKTRGVWVNKKGVWVKLDGVWAKKGVWWAK